VEGIGEERNCATFQAACNLLSKEIFGLNCSLQPNEYEWLKLIRRDFSQLAGEICRLWFQESLKTKNKDAKA